MNFSIHDLVLLLPEDFLLGAICVILFVDLFLKSPQRIVTHWLSLIAVVATIGILLVDHDPQTTAFNGAYIHDARRCRAEDFHTRHHRCRLRHVAALSGRAQPVHRRVLSARAVRHARHDADGVGRKPRHRVSGSGTVRVVDVRARGDEPRFEQVIRSRDEIFRARRARVGSDAVRHVDDLWRDGHARSGQDPRRRFARVGQSARDAARVRSGVPRRRHRIRIRRGAVPHVAAGCVRRIADGRHRFRRIGAEDRRFRIRVSPARNGSRRSVAALETHDCRSRRGVARHRQRGRHRADELQTHAGVFDDLARRLHPARARQRHAVGLRRRDVLRDLVRHHDHRGVRRHPVCSRARASRPKRSTTSRDSTSATRGTRSSCC